MLRIFTGMDRRDRRGDAPRPSSRPERPASRAAHRLAATLLLALALSAASAEALFVPPGAHVQRVAEDLRVNGVPLEVLRFTSPADPPALLALYRNAWGAGAPLHEQQLGVWIVVGRQVGHRHETVQLRANATGGTEGVVARSDLARRPSSIPVLPLALPRDARVASVVESAAAGTQARTYLIHTRLPPFAALRALARSGEREGYAVSLLGEPGARGGGVLQLRRPPDALWIVARRQGRGTALVALRVRSTEAVR